MRQLILIVEDSLLNQKILKRNLEDYYEIIQAFNGKEALAVIRKQYGRLAAVILDLHMPVMDGEQLLEILKKENTYQNLPILVATGEHDEKMEGKCLKLGAWDFVAKPYNPEIIHLRLSNIIGRSQVQLLKRIQILSERDRLTNLYNRGFFMEKTKEMLEKNPEITYVLIRMDIDNFRLYNSSFGSAAGDELLKKVARVLREKKETNRTYGRIESDVFCICAPYQEEVIIQKLKQVEDRVRGFCTNYRLKLSFGLYLISDIREDMEKMYSCATEAARECKHKINTTYTFYDYEMSQEEEKVQRITNQMETALKEKQFQVYFQPKYSLETSQPCGAEALVRWKHPVRGMVSPGEFIPVFEKNGQIMQLDYYMWENVCILLRKWLDMGMNPYPVSVNISRISLYNPQIVEQIDQLTVKYQVPKSLFNLEITESAYMSNPDLMKKVTSQLRKKGFVLLMDDFGSGYSSLNTLKDIEIDILKIDMKFLPSGTMNVKSEKILASVVRMAGWLGIPVVVEGVETREQKEFLDSIGCSYVQGFYFARPMPLDDYERLMEEEEASRIALPSAFVPLAENLDEIWSSDTRSVTLLKSISVPFAVFEYADGQMDILRSNQAYIQEFGTGSTIQRQLNYQELSKLHNAMDQTVYNKGYAETECLFIMSNGSYRWYRIRLMYIGTYVKTSLIGATYSNVTSERMLERELNTVFGELKGKTEKKTGLLVVDDSEISQDILANLFESEFDIIYAADGQEGLELLEKNQDHIAAILLDMLMPRMGGQEFLAYKNEKPQLARIPVIVISAESNKDIQINMLQNGVNDYVTKPFVSELVYQRVHNVIEYSSRFRALVKEYQKTTVEQYQEEVKISLIGYSMDQVREMMSFMAEVFNLVRLVDPEDLTVVAIDTDGGLQKMPSSCFGIWKKQERCENCTSLCAKRENNVLTKYEVMQNSVFYVISRPITIRLKNGRTQNLVLEVASKIANDTTLQMLHGTPVGQVLEHTQEVNYTDPLTSAFNRRYLEELLFLHSGLNLSADKLGIIMLDIRRFRQINDLFGSQQGDKVLQQTVRVMKEQIRQNDSIIRYGADEFLVILTSCEEEQIIKAMERLQKAVESVRYGTNQMMTLRADFGYAYTQKFQRDQLAPMIQQAEADMKKSQGKA